jgi:hypothetical protein
MKKIILSIAILALVIVGCKKDAINPSSSSSASGSSKILKETSYSLINDTIISDSSVTTYAYDSKGRLISQSNDGYTSNYNYVSASLLTIISKSTYNDSTNYSEKINVILDSKGYATKYYNDLDKDTMVLYYSPDGFLKGNDNQIFEVKDGNVIKQSNATFEYYLDKINTIGNSNKGIYFIGKDSKNLVKSEKYTSSSPNGGSSISEYSYTYEFDSKKRVVKSTRTPINTVGSIGYEVSITKYQYSN